MLRELGQLVPNDDRFKLLYSHRRRSVDDSATLTTVFLGRLTAKRQSSQC